MKPVILPVIFFLLLLLGLNAQGPPSPQAFNYQAIARDNTGNPIANHAIALRFSILDSSASGNSLYSETFNTTTNQFGLFNVNIGNGNLVSGNFSTINWGVNSKWLKVETDITGGSNYMLMGTSQLVSVPYSLYATNSNYAQSLPTIISITGDTLFLGNTNIIVPGISTANACRTFIDTVPYNRNYPHAGDNPYNSFVYGLPKFIVNNYIELDKIDSISRYRSGVGHDYSDSYESCRSMKHYFKPRYDVDWASVKIYAPVNGTIINMFPDSIWGTQIWIMPSGMPAFNVTLFHVNITIPLSIGSNVLSGQQIGTHYGPGTTSDVAIQINAPNNTFQRVSYFDVMTGQLFNCYKSRGIMEEDSFIISKAARDADPLLPCDGQQFFFPGTIPNWVVLRW
jgi:hypothetical protein